jgi:heme/copper-type cytochrome/quinol oxidase subunit 3
MMLQPRFTGDLSSLHTHAFGHRSLTWWGVIAFFMIEGTAFAMGAVAYFFVMNLDQSWPPPDVPLPGLLAGALFTVVLLASEIPNTMLKRAAEKGELRRVRTLILLLGAVGTLLLAIRVFEFASLNVWWSDNAYGSVQWALLFLHTLHIATDWADTIVLAGLMHTRHGQEGRRFVDVAENAMYWRFVWLCWIPFYLMIYWLPRWVP